MRSLENYDDNTNFNNGSLCNSCVDCRLKREGFDSIQNKTSNSITNLLCKSSIRNEIILLIKVPNEVWNKLYENRFNDIWNSGIQVTQYIIKELFPKK